MRDAEGKYHIEGKLVKADKGDTTELTKLLMPIL